MNRITFYFEWIDVYAIISLYQRRCDKSVTFLETDTGWLPAAANDFSSKYDPYSRERTHTHIREWEPNRGRGEKREGKWIMNLREICESLPGFSPFSGNRYVRRPTVHFADKNIVGGGFVTLALWFMVSYSMLWEDKMSQVTPRLGNGRKEMLHEMWILLSSTPEIRLPVRNIDV